MHRTIGIVGGLTPESTQLYYQHIIHTYESRYGDYHYPQIVIYSVSFQQYVDWLNAGQWDRIAEGIIHAIQSLHAAGADFALMATNTPHKIFNQAQGVSPIPLLHILEPVVASIRQSGLKTVAVLGTRFTMEDGFYTDYLKHFDIQSITPKSECHERINRIIFDELGRAKFRTESRDFLLAICNDLIQEGAQGIVLGCTELPLVLKPEDFQISLFNTATLHAEAALERALSHLSEY